MDNQKNKQFYWEVKQFMGGKQQKPVERPKSSLNETASNIMNHNFVYKQSANGAEQPAINQASNFLTSSMKISNKDIPNCPAYTKNKLFNPFNYK